MGSVADAIASQLKNIEKRSGKSLGELAALVKASGLVKHGEIRDMLKRDLGLGHGDANTVTHHVLKQEAAPAGEEPAIGPAATGAEAGAAGGDPADEIYVGPKAVLRPIHDRLMAEISAFGDFEISPKKGYLSLRRQKQFAMIGPATNTRVEVGLNAKELAEAERLQKMPPKGMCDYKVRLADAGEVDAELIGWIRQAFDSAG